MLSAAHSLMITHSVLLIDNDCLFFVFLFVVAVDVDVVVDVDVAVAVAAICD